ncbi:MAG: cytochrome o ubiquinol oxidase subunit IV [Candidatus Saccharimonadales bacterium]
MNAKYHLVNKEPPSSDTLIAEHEHPALLKHYVIGFVASLILTLSAYLITVNHAGNKWLLFMILAALAFAQFIVQLFYFLHVGREFPPRLKLLLTCFMVLVVTILVGGSLWIMFNLNNRVMPSTTQMERYMNSQDNL